MSYASEANRVARRQWELLQGTAQTGLSIEVLVYGTPEDAAAALAEFTATTKACTAATITVDGSTLVQHLTSSGPLKPPEGVTGYEGYVTARVTPATGAAFTVYTHSAVQRADQYLSIVWTNQGTAFAAQDIAAIHEYVSQQGEALAQLASATQ
jgi:hypothetical protein